MLILLSNLNGHIIKHCKISVYFHGFSSFYVEITSMENHDVQYSTESVREFYTVSCWFLYFTPWLWQCSWMLGHIWTSYKIKLIYSCACLLRLSFNCLLVCSIAYVFYTWDTPSILNIHLCILVKQKWGEKAWKEIKTVSSFTHANSRISFRNSPC